MIDPAENLVRIDAALKTLGHDITRMNAENYNNIVTQTRHIQDLAWQIERWATPRSDAKDNFAAGRGWQSWHDLEKSFFNLLGDKK